MRSGAAPLLAVGAALIGLAVLGAAVFGLDALPSLVLAGAGAAACATGIAAAVAEHRRSHGTPPGEPILTGSAATTVAALGAALAMLGLTAGGPAFTYTGLGIMVAGLAGIAREWRAARRERRS